MLRIFLGFLFVSLSIVGMAIVHKNHKPSISTPVQYGALVKVWTSQSENRTLAIRILILRHASEQMAHEDADLVIQAVERAKQKGLAIQVIGNHLVQNVGELEQIVKQKVNVGAIPGDTLIVHTIGHGFAGGGLMNLGQRIGVMKVLATVAEQNQQEMLWWQLSCHAASRLPDINSLPGSQQSIFSNLASSSAEDVSASGVQGRIMEKVFIALADRNSGLDADKDGTVTAMELRHFLNGIDNSHRGDLLFAASPNEPIFGVFGPWMLPIVDREYPQREYDRNFIPVPRR